MKMVWSLGDDGAHKLVPRFTHLSKRMKELGLNKAQSLQLEVSLTKWLLWNCLWYLWHKLHGQLCLWWHASAMFTQPPLHNQWISQECIKLHALQLFQQTHHHLRASHMHKDYTVEWVGAGGEDVHERLGIMAHSPCTFLFSPVIVCTSVTWLHMQLHSNAELSGCHVLNESVRGRWRNWRVSGRWARSRLNAGLQSIAGQQRDNGGISAINLTALFLDRGRKRT